MSFDHKRIIQERSRDSNRKGLQEVWGDFIWLVMNLVELIIMREVINIADQSIEEEENPAQPED